MTTDTQPIIDVALDAAPAQALDEGLRFFHVVSRHGTDLIDLDAERRKLDAKDRPHRKEGAYSVHDADSFITYVSKHGDAATEVWADTTRSTVTAVLDAHTGDDPRFEGHRVTYAVQLTDAWKAWAAHDGDLLDQGTFAEHIEDRAVDIIKPSGAEMLELAQSFQATIGVQFDSSKALASGERQLTYRESVDATAGRTGQMDIPAAFELALIPFEGAEAFKVKARFRYRITNGQLKIGYRLERPEDVLRLAFLGVVGAIQSGVDVPILRGSRP